MTPGPARNHLMPLLLLADVSETQVRSYWQQGDLYVLRGDDGAARGIALAIPQANGDVELKSVAVAPELQGQGVGRRMLALVPGRAANRRRAGAMVGTASCRIGQLAFYQNAGFRLCGIERGFFSTARGYPQGLEENGIPLRDMVWMDQEL